MHQGGRDTDCGNPHSSPARINRPTTLREGTTSRIPSYTLKKSGAKKDPVNVVLINADTADLRKDLSAHGWEDVEGFSQYLRLNDEMHEQDEQLGKGHFATSRFHLRAWDFPSKVIGSAHYEVWQLFRHKVYHFDGAKREVTRDLTDTKNWVATPDKYKLSPEDNVSDSNGYATEVRKK